MYGQAPQSTTSAVLDAQPETWYRLCARRVAYTLCVPAPRLRIAAWANSLSEVAEGSVQVPDSCYIDCSCMTT